MKAYRTHVRTINNEVNSLFFMGARNEIRKLR